MASVELKSVSKIFRPKKGEVVCAVNNLTLHVADKELVVFVGPSGCGKTTALRLIAGLEEPSAGSIAIDGINMDEVRPQDRGVAMVFQSHALYPHMTVFENMAFGLELRRVAKPERESRVKATASMLGISALLDRYPAALSGGQRQRVALGRAIVRHPKVFLFDEPLSNLDTPMRGQMRTELARLHQRLGATMIYVTHDQAEAMTLGQRIVVLKEGSVQQIAEPLSLYHSPANMFVAGFIGSPPMNFFRGRVMRRDGSFVFQENNSGGATNGSRIELVLSLERGEQLSGQADGNVVLGIRPEHISIRDNQSSDKAVNATIELAETTGAERHLHFETGAHHFVARVSPDVRSQPGERVSLRFDMAKAIFFDPASEARIV